MKKIFLLSIICVFIMSANQVTALTYNDELPQGNGVEKITSSQKSEAKLLQIYIHRYQGEINTLYNSYTSKDSSIMNESNQILNKMSRVLTKIQNQEVDSMSVDEVMSSIILDLRDLNSSMEIYLGQQEEIHIKQLQIEKEKYLLLGKKISDILDRIINSLTQSLLEKGELSEKEKEIVRNLVVIRDQNNRIKEFDNQFFNSKAEMQLYFKNIVQNIRSSLRNIKDLAR